MSADIIVAYDRSNKPIILKEEDRFLGTLINGPTGSGKSSQLIIPMIFQDLVNTDVGITLFDPKEETYNKVKNIIKLGQKDGHFNRKIIFVDPSEKDCPKLNFLEGEPNKVINNLFSLFIKNSMDNNIKEASRILISNTINIFTEYKSIFGSNLNLQEFYNFITNKDNESRTKLNKIKDNSKNDVIDWFLRDFFNFPSKNYELTFDLRTKIGEIINNPYLKNFFTPKRDEKNIIDFSKHIDNADAIFINTGSGGLGKLGKIFGESLMISYVNAIFNRKSLAPNIIYIDEFATYYPVTADIFTKGRSFKIAPVIAIQTRKQFDLLGLEDTHAIGNIIENNLRNIFLFGGLSKIDIDYYVDNFLIGEKSSLVYLEFGNIYYRIIQDRNIQRPKIGKVYFIDENIPE